MDDMNFLSKPHQNIEIKDVTETTTATIKQKNSHMGKI